MSDTKHEGHTGHNEVHTYEDGTQVVGTAPFPAKSPRANVEVAVDAPRPMHIPHGMKTSGKAAPAEAPGTTAEQFKAKVKQQLESDVTSGKDADTPNPTVASDKPMLANVVTADQIESAMRPVTQDDLDRMASGVSVKGASKEQVAAAALQVARETPGPIPAKSAKK